MALPASARLPAWLLLVSVRDRGLRLFEHREGAVRIPYSGRKSAGLRVQLPVARSFYLPVSPRGRVCSPAPFHLHHEGCRGTKPVSQSVASGAIEGHSLAGVNLAGVNRSGDALWRRSATVAIANPIHSKPNVSLRSQRRASAKSACFRRGEEARSP